MIDKLDLLSKDELKELVRIYARNIYALDGVWFQSVEGKNGMDEAMLHDGFRLQGRCPHPGQWYRGAMVVLLIRA